VQKTDYMPAIVVKCFPEQALAVCTQVLDELSWHLFFSAPVGEDCF